MAKKNRYARDMELNIPAEASEALPQHEEAPEEIAEVVMEKPKRAEAPKVQFDGWWAARASAIPAIHKKEIIKADFKGQKVPMVATMAEFDAALKKYGVALA